MPYAASNLARKHPLADEPLAAVGKPTSDRDVLDAVITMAALVAKADGWIAVSEREALYRFVVRMALAPELSRVEILDMFEARIRDLRASGGANVLEGLAAAADSRPGPIVEVGERVARADGLLDPRERHILHAFKTMMMATKRVEPWGREADAPRQ